MHNGLRSRVTSNGLVDNSSADIASRTNLAGTTGKSKKKSKSLKHDTTNQSTFHLQNKIETANEKQVMMLKNVLLEIVCF